MPRKPNPALLGGFVLGAVVLAVAALVVFGSGKFFRTTQSWVAYFDESIKGLSIGAPVTFRGVKIGAVTDVRVVVDTKTGQVRTPVNFELEADRLSTVEGQELRFLPGAAGVKTLIDRGLRAQLETQSLVTGQLAINLDFHPNSPLRLAGGPDKHPEFPTVPSTVTALVSRIERGLEQLNVAELANDVKIILHEVAGLVSGPEIKQALAGLDRLLVNADAKVTALGAGLGGATTKTNETLDAVRALVQRVDSQTVTALNDTLRDAQKLVQNVDAQTMPAVNQFIGELRPLIAEFEKTAGTARGALERAETTLATVDGVVGDRSPLQYQLRLTLQELAAAARAFRMLSTYLERNPDSVIFGKPAR
jgi:paraquat-inducible protein B